MNSGSLLNYVSGFVCGGVQVGCLAKRDGCAGRVRLGADCRRSDSGGTTDVRSDSADVMVSEGLLDAFAVREFSRCAGDAFRRPRVNRWRTVVQLSPRLHSLPNHQSPEVRLARG